MAAARLQSRGCTKQSARKAPKRAALPERLTDAALVARLERAIAELREAVEGLTRARAA